MNVYVKIDQENAKTIQVNRLRTTLCAVCNKIKKEDIKNFVMYYNNEHKKQNDRIPATTEADPLLIITKVG